jgi:DNA-binding transcriptional LysR family regulator
MLGMMDEKHFAELDLDLLITLDALIRAKQVSRVAIELGITQPTMSRRLKRLRDVFEDPILVPSRFGPRLTPRAESMREPLRRVFDSLNAMLDGIQNNEQSYALASHCSLNSRK